jgi:hypothetical protein
MSAVVEINGERIAIADGQWTGVVDLVTKALEALSYYDHSPSDGDPDSAEAEYVAEALSGTVIYDMPNPRNIDPNTVY